MRLRVMPRYALLKPNISRSPVCSECFVEVRLHNRSEKRAVAPCSWTPKESQVERCEHQDDSNIHCQPFPESVSEEHEIYTDYDGCHRHHVKHDSYLSAHFSSFSPSEQKS